MAKGEHLSLLKRGVVPWNQWREQNPTVRPDFRKADLHRSNLVRANLALANLSGADLRHANLTRAILNEANLKGANLSHSLLSRTTLGNVDLGVAIGLDTIIHRGPSTIGIDTIYRSKSPLPLAFLRGAGVPDRLIDYLPSLVSSQIEFYSCFISYSNMDQEFAGRLHADLQSNGVRCWFAPERLTAGQSLRDQLDSAIKIYDKLLLIISSHSMRSTWVAAEIAVARERERREKRRLLFPIALAPSEAIRNWRVADPITGQDVPSELAEYLIPDFSQWTDHDSYRTSFLLLLRSLTTPERPVSRHV
jgi:hypothetical protein